MNNPIRCIPGVGVGKLAALLAGIVLLPLAAAAQGPVEATITVHADRELGQRIPKLLTGKFCEHLGSNIDNGMSAQVLQNPTFGDFPFWTGAQTPDGYPRLMSDESDIADYIRQRARRLRWPADAIEKLQQSHQDSLAHWWVRVGDRNQVLCSPDSGPAGGRAQRLEMRSAGTGIEQYAWLPLHRVRKFNYRLVVRAPKLTALTLALTPERSAKPVASTRIGGIRTAYTALTGSIQIPDDAPADALYRISLTAPEPGQVVVARLLLYPADAINGADPDVIRLLKASHLPLLRWPGGNFVSGYHWRDGVGPPDERPTRPNPAWGGLENNLFGTDEFIAFCRAVGCEPMICVNGGDGTPQEAADWIAYCNDPPTTPLGALRAKNGHPQPYGVKIWEVGNELWGHWQVHWTTAAGYADRYRCFAPLMQKADPSITLYACGAPVMWGRDWNLTLFKADADILQRTTDHPLVGGNVSGDVEPMDVYRDFMAVPDLLGRKWAQLRQDMLDAGIRDPRLAVTELQMFAHLGGAGAKLNRWNLVTPSTQAEAAYDTLIYHTAIRLQPFVDFITQSATVNHGGGLRKERERVYANPCYYAHAAFSAFDGAMPVACEVKCPTTRAPLVLPEVKPHAPIPDYPVISAVAAKDAAGALLVSIVNRGSEAAKVTVNLTGAGAAKEAAVWSLSAAHPWSANSLTEPEAVVPAESTMPIAGGAMTLEVAPCGVVRLRVAR